MQKSVAIALALVLSFGLQAQQEAPDNWYNLDRTTNNYPGVSADKALEYLKGKTGQKVVVAVIDSGVDIEHEDLKDIIWTNTDEIPGNNRDDDNNGYVDDIHGWNFIGGADGQNVNYENLEIVRIYNRYAKKYANRNVDGLPKDQKAEYKAMEEYKKIIDEKKAQWEPQLAQVGPMFDMAKGAVEAIGKKPADITKEDVEGLSDDKFGVFKGIAARFMAETDFKGFYDEIEGYVEYMEGQVKYNYNTDFDARDIVGDDPSDVDDTNYGNNDVKGPDSMHGTHVSGIIAAVRGNGIGVEGVGGANVQIMSIRTVPNGDERDKDVANAIRYAVDNGASIINMSFGKGYSPYKGAVDAAVKYAEKNDVLLVHAAGNDGKKLTLTNNYPNDVYLKKGFLKPKSSRTWIEVGASSKDYDEALPASFSNYNKTLVDVFAPGHDIYSTFPEDEYSAISGTSMAAPMVAGIAAMLRSYFPDLTARQVREIILASAIPVELDVTKPGSEDSIKFSQLSATGSIANAFTAVKQAEVTKGKKKKTPARDASLSKF
ncbi:MAG: S8 family serine peptidase [Bacteroidota bacterium]